jgi:hypothetical protein
VHANHGLAVFGFSHLSAVEISIIQFNPGVKKDLRALF